MITFDHKIIAVFFAFIVFNSCSNSVAPPEPIFLDISAVKNIQWNLVSLEDSSGSRSVSDYKPFRVILLEDRVWGYDFCNYVFAKYSIKDDNLIVPLFSQTAGWCSYIVFPFKHLSQSPKVSTRGKDLVLSINDTNYVYSSNFTEDISHYVFLNDTLVLRSSNDSDFAFFESLKTYPKLILNSEREYSVLWYNKDPKDTRSPNSFSGVFGLNGNNEFLFTSITGYFMGNNITNSDWELVHRIIYAKNFEYKNGVLKLKNNATGTYYNFSR